MSYKSRKNINAVLHDVKHPKTGPRVAKKETSGPAKVAKKAPERRKSFRHGPVFVGFLIGIVISSSIYVLYATGAAGNVISSVKNWDFDLSDGNSDELVFSTDTLFQLPSFFGDITEVINAIREISGGVSDLNSRGLALVFSGSGGGEFIDILKKIHTSLVKLNDIGFDLDGQISKFAPGGGDLNNLATDAQNLEDGLGAVISFLDVSYDRKIVLFFENHSEIRPSGGFVGSYAEVVLDKGSVKSIEVDDIYTPDRNVKYKIVPPKQLQGITVNWGARDANWFFDFPVSAEKTLELLEASEMYVNDGVKFDGAIAINANVVSDVLRIVGPIYVPEHDITLTSENFILAVREEVEEARDENPKENPKQILGLIAPTIIERVQNLDKGAKTDLILTLLGRAVNKDLKFYFRDGELQKFIKDTQFSGSVYDLPEVFNGDYLAVVNANIAGGKSDLFVNQSITLNSKISPAGNVENSLTVERTHFGQSEDQELYRKTNQNFIKIFTPLEITLNSELGAQQKTVEPRIDYKEEGYSVDSVLNEVESTSVDIRNSDLSRYLESGKNVFAGWFSTPPGETRTLSADYSRGGLFIGHGAKYQFIFDKQSGVESSLQYTVSAPDGYIWRESGNGSFTYFADSTPGRVVLNLTLVRKE